MINFELISSRQTAYFMIEKKGLTHGELILEEKKEKYEILNVTPKDFLTTAGTKCKPYRGHRAIFSYHKSLELPQI